MSLPRSMEQYSSQADPNAKTDPDARVEDAVSVREAPLAPVVAPESVDEEYPVPKELPLGPNDKIFIFHAHLRSLVKELYRQFPEKKIEIEVELSKQEHFQDLVKRLGELEHQAELAEEFQLKSSITPETIAELKSEIKLVDREIANLYDVIGGPEFSKPVSVEKKRSVERHRLPLIRFSEANKAWLVINTAKSGDSQLVSFNVAGAVEPQIVEPQTGQKNFKIIYPGKLELKFSIQQSNPRHPPELIFIIKKLDDSAAGEVVARVPYEVSAIRDFVALTVTPLLTSDGSFYHPLVTPDEKIIIAASFDDKGKYKKNSPKDFVFAENPPPPEALIRLPTESDGIVQAIAASAFADHSLDIVIEKHPIVSGDPDNKKDILADRLTAVSDEQFNQNAALEDKAAHREKRFALWRAVQDLVTRNKKRIALALLPITGAIGLGVAADQYQTQRKQAGLVTAEKVIKQRQELEKLLNLPPPINLEDLPPAETKPAPAADTAHLIDTLLASESGTLTRIHEGKQEKFAKADIMRFFMERLLQRLAAEEEYAPVKGVDHPTLLSLATIKPMAHSTKSTSYEISPLPGKEQDFKSKIIYPLFTFSQKINEHSGLLRHIPKGIKPLNP